MNTLEANTILTALQNKIAFGPYRNTSAFSILINVIAEHPGNLYLQHVFFRTVLEKICHADQAAAIDAFRTELLNYKDALKSGLKKYLSGLSCEKLSTILNDGGLVSELIDHHTGFGLFKTRTREYVEDLLHQGEIRITELLESTERRLPELKARLAIIDSNAPLSNRTECHEQICGEIKAVKAMLALMQQIIQSNLTFTNTQNEFRQYTVALDNLHWPNTPPETTSLIAKLDRYITSTVIKKWEANETLERAAEKQAAICVSAKLVEPLHVAQPVLTQRLFAPVKPVVANKPVAPDPLLERLMAQIQVPKGALVESKSAEEESAPRKRMALNL